MQQTADANLPRPADGAQPRLRMCGIRKAFGPTVALDGVDLSVMPGQVLGLVGENGAGKSTLMKILSGVHPADEGRMFLDGKPYRPAGPLQARRAGVAMIYQELSLAPHLSVQENILLGIEPRRMGFIDWKAMRRAATEALSQLGHADIDPAAPVAGLTIARQQLVEIARALATGCGLLVLDEPTSSLTQADALRLFDLIDRLRAQGRAIIYISHFLEEIRRVADRFVVLRDGRSVAEGDPAATPPRQIVSLMVGRQIRELYPRSVREEGPVVLDLANLAGLVKPANASLQLRQGQVLGIAGLVGAGRTEMLRALYGLDPIASGQIRIARLGGPPTLRPARAATPAARWKDGVGLVSENRKEEGLALSLSIADNLTLTRLEGRGPAGFISPGRQRAAAAKWIDRLLIKCDNPHQPVSALSGGNQQKVAIARLLHHDAEILLLDEPTRGIDVGSKAQIYQLIDQLAQPDAATGRPARAILMISSYLPELLGICDRIAVMCRGVLGPARPASELDEHSIMLQATGQEAAP